MTPAENERHDRFVRSFTANELAIRAYVRRLVPTRSDADDVMQEVSVVQGRWPGSLAPEFINGGDHLRLDLSGEQTWPQLTLAAWVRLDRLGAPHR